jgi:hypothetical protein
MPWVAAGKAQLMVMGNMHAEGPQAVYSCCSGVGTQLQAMMLGCTSSKRKLTGWNSQYHPKVCVVCGVFGFWGGGVKVCQA